MALNEREVEEALGGLRPSGVLTACRAIAVGDDEALFPSERFGGRSTVSKVLRSSGAARRIARELLRRRGLAGVEIARAASGAPVWPVGIVGSLAHDETFAVAAIADARRFLALGIDVEPAVALPPELIDMVATPTERSRLPLGLLQSRAVFVLKEAVYKAVSPLDGVFLEFSDVELDLETGTASTRTGWNLRIAFTCFPRVLALAYIMT
jgi:4'-phosphopantetheinyl transferase EntD